MMSLVRVAIVALLALAAGCSTADKSPVDAGGDSRAGGDADIQIDIPGQPDAADVSGDDVPDQVAPDGEVNGDVPVDPDTVLPPDVDAVEQPDEVAPPDADDVSETEDTAAEIETDVPVDKSFASPEMGIRILAPAPTRWAQVPGGSIGLAGLVVGKPDTIIWESSSGEAGNAEGDLFWATQKINLDPGDNIVKVTAIKGNEETSDTIRIVYNQAFMFGSPVQVRPRATFVDTNTALIFTVDLGLYSNYTASTLKLCECTEEGECIKDVDKLLDNGNMNNGDEYMGDYIYSQKKSLSFPEAGRHCFRTSVQVQASYLSYTAYSPVTCIDVVEHVTKEQCEQTKAVLGEADKLYWDTVGSSSPADARQAVVDMLTAKAEVAEAGTSVDGFGVWVRFANGMLGAFDFGPEGYRGGEEEEAPVEQIEAPIDTPSIRIASKRTMVLSPYHTELSDLDESPAIQTTLENSSCPTYLTDKAYYDGDATLARFRRMSDYGVVSIAGMGDSYFKQMSPEAKEALRWRYQQSNELVWTGENIDCNQLIQTMPSCSGPNTCQSGADCVITQTSGTSVSGVCLDMKQVDLRTGRAVFGPKTYGIVPAFIEAYREKGFPNSVFYLGTCRSLWNGTLGMELYAAGARAVVGYSGYVKSKFAFEQGKAFFAKLVEELRLTGEAMPETPAEDPDNPGTVLRLLGAPNLDATNSEIINPSFETSDLTGWQATGDGRVVSQLCMTLPVEGKFMGLLSTGMGYTPQLGEIAQTFCIPEDQMEVSFYWKFFSEEFKEWCGSIFQDTFEATLEADDGQITVVSASIDELCPPQECAGCGSQYDGLIQSACVFDQGDVWNTQWRKATSNVMALAGKGPVTMRFFATDKGDSIYDTVILFDAIKFK